MRLLNLDYTLKGENTISMTIFTVVFHGDFNRFKNRTGPQELLFEHHAWMTSQYSIFAELFDDAIRLGLPAVQTQHPGYYFQIASHHAELRQSACQELCKVYDITMSSFEHHLSFFNSRKYIQMHTFIFQENPLLSL